MVPESGPSRTIDAMDLLPINTIDLLVLVLAIAGALIGFRSGAIPQVLGLAAVGAAVFFIVAFAPQLVSALAGLEQPARAFVAIGGAFLVLAMAQAIGSSAGAVMRNQLVGGVGGRIDSALGALLGAAQVVLVTWLVGGLLATSSLPIVAGIAGRSVAVRWLLEVLPPLGDVIGEVGAILDESGLPRVFSGLEPLPAAPIDLPAAIEAGRIAARAIGSSPNRWRTARWSARAKVARPRRHLTTNMPCGPTVSIPTARRTSARRPRAGRGPAAPAKDA